MPGPTFAVLIVKKITTARPSDGKLGWRYKMDPVFFPARIRSQNEFLYSHWRKYDRYKNMWQTAIGYMLGRGTHGNRKKNIKIVSVRTRFLDMGNLIGGAKPIPDALKRYGWIVDDSPRWVEISYFQRRPRRGEGCGTIISVDDD